MNASAQGVVVSKIVLPVGPLIPTTVRFHEWSLKWFKQIAEDTERETGVKPSLGEVIEYVVRPAWEEAHKKDGKK